MLHSFNKIDHALRDQILQQDIFVPKTQINDRIFCMMQDQMICESSYIKWQASSRIATLLSHRIDLTGSQHLLMIFVLSDMCSLNKLSWRHIHWTSKFKQRSLQFRYDTSPDYQKFSSKSYSSHEICWVATRVGRWNPRARSEQCKACHGRTIHSWTVSSPAGNNYSTTYESAFEGTTHISKQAHCSSLDKKPKCEISTAD